MANGTETAQITISLRDYDGHPLPHVAVELSVSGSANEVVPPLSGALTDSDGALTVGLRSTTAETKTISAAIPLANELIALTTHPTIEFVTPVAEQLAFIVQPPPAVALGAIIPPVTLQIQDINGTPRPYESGTVTLYQDPDRAGTSTQPLANGTATFSGLAYMKPGEWSVCAFVGGQTNGAAPQAAGCSSSVLVGASAVGSIVTATPLELPADGWTTSTVTVSIRDDFGNPIANAEVRARAPGESASLNSLSALSPEIGPYPPYDAGVNLTDSSGDVVYAVSATTPGTKTITATAGSLTMSVEVTFTQPGHANELRLPDLPALGIGPWAPSRSWAPSDVAVGDFNSDGKLDLVFPSFATSLCDGRYGNVLAVALGNGDGTFARGPEFNVGIGLGLSHAVAAGDFNGDGVTDIAVGSGEIFFGTADGTFATTTGTFIGITDDSNLAVADFNGDGKADIATELGVCLSQGPYLICKPYGPMVTAAGVAVGDFDGNGIPDVALSGPDLNIMLGRGDGTFDPAPTSGVSLPGWSIAVADFDGDGRMDLAIGGYGAVSSTTPPYPYQDSAGSQKVAILRGKGDGTFESPTQISLDCPARVVTAADLNGDGKPDLLGAGAASDVYDATSRGCLSFLSGNGDGTFAAPSTYPVGSMPYGVAIADVDGDGHPDVVTPNFNGDDVSVLRNDGQGRFEDYTSVKLDMLPYSEPQDPEVDSVSTGDFNCDGHLDVAGPLGVALNDGSGTFSAISYDSSDAAVSVAAADFNGDGCSDVARLVDSGVKISLGGASGFATGTALKGTSATDNFHGAIASDFNGDDKADLAVVGASTQIYLGNGDGTFRVGVNISGTATPVVAADFNLDGKVDLAMGNGAPPNQGGAVSLVLGNGDGTFQTPVTMPLGAVDVVKLAAGDLNGDGRPDLVVAPSSCWEWTDASSQPNPDLLVLLGNGDGTFQSPQSYAACADVVGLADLDGDGRMDVLTGTYSSGLSVHLANGDGTLQTPVLFGAGSAGGLSRLAAITAGDFDRDGRSDVAVYDGAGYLNILLNRTPSR